MENTYRISDVIDRRFLKLPLSLFADPEYRALSAESKLIYALLLDRMGLSQKNGWMNDEGEVYLIYTREEAAKTLGITYKKTIAAFKELISAGLLAEKRQGRGFPNLLFVLKTTLADDDAEEFGSEFDGEQTEENEEKEPANPHDTQICRNGSSRTDKREVLDEQNGNIKTCENGISRSDEQEVLDVRNRQSSNIYNNNTYKSESENNQSVSRELDGILTNCHFETFEKNTANMLSDAVRTLYYTERIKVGEAVLPKEEIRRLLNRVNSDTLIDVLEIMRRNDAEIRNPTGYLYSLILNCVSADRAAEILELPGSLIKREMLYASD